MEKKKKWVLLSLSIPAFLLIFIFMIVPLGNAVRVSFFKWNGYSQKMKFIGLENYISLFQTRYSGALHLIRLSMDLAVRYYRIYSDFLPRCL